MLAAALAEQRVAPQWATAQQMMKSDLGPTHAAKAAAKAAERAAERPAGLAGCEVQRRAKITAAAVECRPRAAYCAEGGRGVVGAMEVATGQAQGRRATVPGRPWCI